MGKILIQLTNRLILDILEKNLNFKRECHPIIGDCITLSDFDAYIFSIIASLSYLNNEEDDKLSKFPRERYIVYNQAEEYNFQNGLFDRSALLSLFNTNTDYKKYSFIKDGNRKYIFILEYRDIPDLQEKINLTIKNLHKNGYNEKSFLVLLKHISKSNPRNFESFFEYVVSKKFNSLGFMTDSQIPFYYGSGTPDLAAYNISELNANISSFSIVELMTFRVFPRKVFNIQINKKKLLKDEAYVFEAKVNQPQAKEQIKKYLKLQIFNEAFELIPVQKKVQGEIGLVSIDRDGILNIQKSLEKPQVDLNKQRKYLQWLIDYIKCYLLANLNAEELEKVLNSANKDMNIDDFNSFVKNTPLSQVILLLKQYFSL